MMLSRPSRINWKGLPIISIIPWQCMTNPWFFLHNSFMPIPCSDMHGCIMSEFVVGRGWGRKRIIIIF